MQLTDEDGTDLGTMPATAAAQIAKDRALMLFFLNLDVNPPMVRLLDYRRYTYELEKRKRKAKTKHHVVHLKELRLRHQIAKEDYPVKLASAANILK